jgi:hypothetical protein
MLDTILDTVLAQDRGRGHGGRVGWGHRCAHAGRFKELLIALVIRIGEGRCEAEPRIGGPIHQDGQHGWSPTLRAPLESFGEVGHACLLRAAMSASISET